MKTRYFIIIVSALIIGGGVYYFIYNKGNKKFEWKSAKITRGNISVLVTATGSVNADTTVSVGTQVSGTVAKLYADWNTPVKQGSIIALIDTTFLSAARINAQATLEKAQVQVNQTKRDLNRYKQLVDEKVVSQSDYETYLTNYESACASLTSAKAALNQSLVNLQYAVIRAPVSGVVISRNVELGQTVAASFNTPTLFTIANDLKKMQVLATVDEADVGQIRLGQKADFTVDAYPDTIFSGDIFQIRLQPTMVQNVVNYIVVINVRNSDLKLLPGMTTNLKVKVKEHLDILKVPVNALHFAPPEEYISSVVDSLKMSWTRIFAKNSHNKTDINVAQNKYAFIWVKSGDDIFPKKVLLGLTDGAFTEVFGEIHEGDEVVTGSKALANAATTNPFMPSMPSRR